jgi:hypothetical protein
MSRQKRNPTEYLKRAEEQIDRGWKGLKIFQSDRAAALLKLVTAADDRMRLAFFSGVPVEAQLLTAVRPAQQGLNYGVRWINRRCKWSNSHIPEFVNEADAIEGVELLNYADAYDSAVLAFTNFHRGLYKPFLAARDPRITFQFSSEESDLDDTEKRAYELEEFFAMPPEFSKDELSMPFSKLISMIPTKAEKQEGDRVSFRVNGELIEVLREVAESEMKMNPADIPVFWKFSGIPYENIRLYRGTLSALSYAHEFLHRSQIVSEIVGLGISSLAFRMSVTELNQRISILSGLDERVVERISQMFTFDGSIEHLDPICQPLLLANKRAEIIVPRAYVYASKWERNLLKLLAKNPLTKSEYDSFSSSKEEIAFDTLVPYIKGFGIVVKARVNIISNGKLVTDVDLLLFDPRDHLLLVVQHKWLIEPDSVNESKDCDQELLGGIRQAELAKQHLSNALEACKLMPEIPIEGFILVEGLVVCRGLEPSGFVREKDTPVVTEKWFKQQLAKSHCLGEIFRLAKDRPDRKNLSRDWTSIFKSVRIAGYELRIPAIEKALEEE